MVRNPGITSLRTSDVLARLRFAQAFMEQVVQGLDLEVDHLSLGGVLVPGGLDGSAERGLPFGSSSTLASVAFAPHVGVVDLDPLRKDPPVLTLQHDLEQLVLHIPSSLEGDPDLPLQFQSRDPVLALGEHVHGQEPLPQG